MENVRTVRSDWRRLPAVIERSVFDTAVALGRPVVDDPFGNRVELLERGDRLRDRP